VHVNEGLADFMVDKAEAALGGSLRGRTIGLLGLAFKADCDDTRTSLSFRVKKVLDFRGAKVLAHDPYVPESAPLDAVLGSDAVVLCTPHREYKSLRVEKPLVDVWGLLRRSPLDVLPGTRKGPPR
jgi:UDP-N-acetyl-D-mannosaminuronic acid dehydrogenase